MYRYFGWSLWNCSKEDGGHRDLKSEEGPEGGRGCLMGASVHHKLLSQDRRDCWRKDKRDSQLSFTGSKDERIWSVELELQNRRIFVSSFEINLEEALFFFHLVFLLLLVCRNHLDIEAITIKLRTSLCLEQEVFPVKKIYVKPTRSYNSGAIDVSNVLSAKYHSLSTIIGLIPSP